MTACSFRRLYAVVVLFFVFCRFRLLICIVFFYFFVMHWTQSVRLVTSALVYTENQVGQGPHALRASKGNSRA